ncbi:PilT protein-like protein [Novosphingobium nitrogenifigens DSM 19370]|uniref:PilT protein-like protein n=1 Tax=Novosphingobium nitrogenifigens DSM 19370 TaxID=983920 RepID=F1ZDM5_9SPHN|nr:PIN domain-containing protein [Novosphingobium nitrogenifigens]EGD57391.1 PilT protein-like protein [Novosphingobium nitrogenifigens DSM 19370]
MNEAVFDRDILLDALHGLGGADAELTRFPRRFISRLTWIDMLTAALPDETARIEGFLSHFSVIDLSEDIARRAAMLRGDRWRLDLADAIVLASAQTSGRILVTRNIRAFPATMPGIRVPYTI